MTQDLTLLKELMFQTPKVIKRTLMGTISSLGERELYKASTLYSSAEVTTDDGQKIRLGETTLARDCAEDFAVGQRITAFVSTLEKSGKAWKSFVWVHRDEQTGELFYNKDAAKARTALNGIRWTVLLLSPLGLFLFVVPFFYMVYVFWASGKELAAYLTREELEAVVLGLRT